MAIIRVNHNKNYTVMSNVHLRDKRLTLRAKGLLSQMLSLPPDWDFSVEGLARLNPEQVGAISSTLTELRKGGYLVVTKKYPNETQSGRIEYVYDVYEEPKQEGEKQALETQGVELQALEAQDIESRGQLNTNKGNTMKRPTLEEVKAYCSERKNSVDAQRFVDYYTANGWKVGKNPMRDWRAAVRTWERNEQKDTSKHFENERQYGDDFFAKLEGRK